MKKLRKIESVEYVTKVSERVIKSVRHEYKDGASRTTERLERETHVAPVYRLDCGHHRETWNSHQGRRDVGDRVECIVCTFFEEMTHGVDSSCGRVMEEVRQLVGLGMDRLNALAALSEFDGRREVKASLERVEMARAWVEAEQSAKRS